MHAIPHDAKPNDEVHTFVRNRYFYGKRLDVFHFELESDYLNGKRWLLNRLLSGYGVLCGLDVQVAPAGRAVVVTPGVAIDRAGREIIVPRTVWRAGGPAAATTRDAGAQQAIASRRTMSTSASVSSNARAIPHPSWSMIAASYCLLEPPPIRSATDASSATARRPTSQMVSGLPDLVLNGRLNYHALVERVTRGCPALPADVCIPLASIRLPPGDDPPEAVDIDISPRPIVYSNDLLFDMFLALGGEAVPRNRGGKQ